VAAALPAVGGRFATHAAWAAAGMDEVLAGLPAGAVREAARLESAVLLNRGGHFTLRPLPAEAQFAPVFGLVVADADGDGAEDVFAAQNLFGLRPGVPRLDGGAGVWLRGDGRGGFQAWSPAASGVAVWGEGRGAAAADFDGDGRVDLAVGQHGAATRLFRNAGARPGVRVRLAGPPENPAGLGARLRVVGAAGAAGPAREVRAGGGWLSQDGAATVLARPADGGEVEVRWPGGAVTRAALPAAGGGVTIAWRP
jgi:hypothetical protein